MDLYAYLEVWNEDDRAWTLTSINRSDGFLEEVSTLRDVKGLMRLNLSWNFIVARKLTGLVLGPMFPGLIYRDTIKPVSSLRGIPPDSSPAMKQIFNGCRTNLTGWLYLDEILKSNWEESLPVCGWVTPEEFTNLEKNGHPEDWEIVSPLDTFEKLSPNEWSKGTKVSEDEVLIFATWSQPLGGYTSDFVGQLRDLDEKVRGFLDLEFESERRARLTFYIGRKL